MDNKQHGFMHGGADKYNKMNLVDQITEMKRTIEDLKQKVTEQREQLWKEKNENDQMIKQQEIFRRQLSMFHLPHCPVLTSPPCPVHSANPVSPRDTELCRGDQDTRSYDDTMFDQILRGMRLEAQGSCEDLFPPSHDITVLSPRRDDVTALSPRLDDVTSFALMLTESCRSRLRETQHTGAADGLTPASAKGSTGHNEKFKYQFEEERALPPYRIFPI